MKKFVFALVIFVIAGLFLSGCSDSLSPVDQGNQSSLEKDIIAWFNVTGYPLEVLEPGTVKIVGNNMIAKDMVLKARFESDNPLVNGILIFTNNGKLNIYTGEGRIHGQLSIIPDIHPDNEIWVGNYTGKRERVGESEWHTSINEHAKGYNGVLEGLHIYVEETVITTDIFGATGFLSNGTGYIK